MAKAIREVTGKDLLTRYLGALSSQNEKGLALSFPSKAATVTADTDFAKLVKDHPWLETEVWPTQGLRYFRGRQS